MKLIFSSDVVDLFGEADEVADAVGVAVSEGADVDLVDDRILVPERVGGGFGGGHDRSWSSGSGQQPILRPARWAVRAER